MSAKRIDGRFDMLVKAAILAVIVGWILVIGRAILVPIIVAAISVYVLAAASDTMGRWPVLGRLPSFMRRILLLGLFILALVALVGVVISTVEEMIATAPSYQENLESIINQITGMLPFDAPTDWERIRDASLEQVNFQKAATVLAGSAGSLLGSLAAVFIYALFLLAERGNFAHKLAVAMPGRDSAEQTATIISDINDRIGTYLSVKTLINAILGAICYVILLAFGVDYAAFWAIIIALMNYIPYVGSLAGVTLPVLLTVAQFGSLQTTLAVGALLTSAQVFVGSFLEPKMIGRTVNLSPFVVLVALSVWSSLWGMAGAILAVPLTSVLTIIFAAFPPTRPISVLLADDVTPFEGDKPGDPPVDPNAR